jgi:hypothetical protein
MQAQWRAVPVLPSIALLGALWLAACGTREPAPPAGDGIDPSLPVTEPDFVEADRGDAATADAGSDDADASLDAGDTPDAAVPDGGADGGSADLASLERLLVADGRQAQLYVFDVRERKVLKTFNIDERARVYAGATGRFGYALFNGRALVIDMGLVQQGGSHFAVLQAGPIYPLTTTLGGSAPGALLAHAGKVAVFFEGDAKASVLDESSLPADFAAQTIALGAPHAGFAFPFGDATLATREQAGEIALRRFVAGDDDGSSFDCTAPDLAAVASGVAAVGCDNGVLRLSEGGSPHFLPYPTASGPTRVRARRLVGNPSRGQILAWLGDALCAIGSTMICQPVAADCIDLSFDAAGERALLLASDGSVHAFEAHTLDPLGALSVTGPVTGDDVLMAPALAAGLHAVYVSDPQTGRVHALNPTSLQLSDEFELSGAPGSLAAFSYHDPF